MTNPVVVFDGEHLRASLFPGDLTQLMVTLDYRMPGKADFSAPNHSTNFARSRYAQLSIKTRRNDWFINADTAALEQVLIPLGRQFQRVHVLGFSMGGYGAFRFARALSARSVVAISPQMSIHPDVVPFDRRYRAEAEGFDPVLGDLQPVAMQGVHGLVVFDPFIPADLRHAQMLQMLFPALRLVRLGFGGHPAIRVLREAGKSWTLHREAAALTASPKLILQGHRAGRRQSAGYWQRLATRAAGRHPDLAAFARGQVRQLDPTAIGPE